MALSRSPSSTTFTKKEKKIGCFGGLRPYFNAIRSILPGRRIPLHSPPTFYVPLSSYSATKDDALTAVEASAGLFSRPSSPIFRAQSPSLYSEPSFDWIDNLPTYESDEESLYSIDLSDIHLETSSTSNNELFPSNLIVYRLPEPAQNPILPIEPAPAA